MNSERRLPRIIALVGFMGAGKTSVGQALAARIGCRVVDLDDLIVNSEGKSVSAVFAENGESYFRAAESRELERFLANIKDTTVLSLGGGAYVSERNRETLRVSKAVVVHLSASVEELRRRIGSDGERPLARDPDKFQNLFRVRQQAYKHADLEIHTQGLTIDQVAAGIIEALNLRSSTGKQRPDPLQSGGQF